MTPKQLRERHSVRSYSSQPLTEKVVRSISAEITYINTHVAGMHFELVTENPEPFQGLKASYGMFKGVRNFIAAVIDTTYPGAWINAGYYGEQLAMHAVSLGLGTCFVGGTFDKSAVPSQLRAGWKLPFVIALGYPAKKTDTFISSILVKAIHRKSKSALDFLNEPTEDKIRHIQSTPWLLAGFRALESAPSAMNRQPVRISLEGDMITASAAKADNGLLIDLGIALWNFASATGGEWEIGNPAIFLPPCAE